MARRGYIQLLQFSVLVCCFFLAGCRQTTEPSGQSSSSVAPAIRVSGASGALPIFEKLAAAYEKRYPNTKFEFNEATNSAGAIRGVTQQIFDIAVSDRPLTESESQLAILAHPFARDAIVFAVNRPNRMRRLTSEQIREIYKGSISRWEQLGNSTGAIFVLTGNPNETARNEALIPIMNGENIDARMIVLASDREMIQSLENTPDSIGYAPLGLISILNTKRISPVTLDGVEASKETLKTNTYPWQLTYSLVYRSQSRGPVREFVDWLASGGGREILEAYGYAAP
jgi:phosphate transport system substrate-binding protein